MSDDKRTAAMASVEADHGYERFREMLAERIAAAEGPIFTTNAAGLFAAFLAALPEDSRQHYNCHCCRRFIDACGGLVTIGENGALVPLLWELVARDVPDYFQKAVNISWGQVFLSRIDGVFIPSQQVLGTPQTGAWTHFYGLLPTSYVHKGVAKSAGELAAEKKEDFGILSRGLAEYPRDAVFQAVRVLEADVVDRSEKTLGLAKWLLALHDAVAVDRKHKDNLVWQAVATAPPGWCHIKSTMISTLLDDVVAGMDFEDIKRKWNAKMHPLRYQRPTTVSDGNLEAANKLMEKLGATGSLQRRYATIKDVEEVVTGSGPESWCWKTNLMSSDKSVLSGAPQKPFDHLKTGGAAKKIKEVVLPAKHVDSIEDFLEIARGANTIEYEVPHSCQQYYGLLTAADPAAPPILQWDGLEGLVRNPLAWYIMHGGSLPYDWNLSTGWRLVTAIFPRPCHLQQPEKFLKQYPGLHFALELCKPVGNFSIGLFPECLRAEFHPIKPAIEAYARSKPDVGGVDESDANGIVLFSGGAKTAKIRVNGTQEYLLPY